MAKIKLRASRKAQDNENRNDIPENECKICGEDYGKYGNNGMPVVDGKVCDECNQRHVIPARIKKVKSHDGFENYVTLLRKGKEFEAKKANALKANDHALYKQYSDAQNEIVERITTLKNKGYDATLEYEACPYGNGEEWAVYAKRSEAYVAFGSEEEMKERAKRLNRMERKENRKASDDGDMGYGDFLGDADEMLERIVDDLVGEIIEAMSESGDFDDEDMDPYTVKDEVISKYIGYGGQTDSAETLYEMFKDEQRFNEQLNGFLSDYGLPLVGEKAHDSESYMPHDDKGKYMLLDRLRSDAEYFLGYGDGYEKHLWAGNVKDQITKMREIYALLPKKPEWLTEEQIDIYEENMMAKLNGKSKAQDSADVQTTAVVDLQMAIALAKTARLIGDTKIRFQHEGKEIRLTLDMDITDLFDGFLTEYEFEDSDESQMHSDYGTYKDSFIEKITDDAMSREIAEELVGETARLEVWL